MRFIKFILPVLILIVMPISWAVAASPIINSHRIIHTINPRNEIIRINANEPVIFMMWYCPGNVAVPNAAAGCQWIDNSAVYKLNYNVKMTGLTPGLYTYRVQIVNQKGLGETVDGEFQN